MSGKLEILNVGTGDTKIEFDKGNPEDIERAKKIIPDMLKRGYALFCEVNGQLERVEAFDPERQVYIVRMPWETGGEAYLEKPKKVKRGTKRTVGLAEGKVVAIGRSAGG
jgi:hypothetical protein